MRSHKFLIICAALSGIGILLAAAGIAAGGFVSGIQLNAAGLHVYAPQLLEKNGEPLYEEKEASLEPFDSMELQMEYADIRLESSDAEEYAISYCIGTQAGIQYEVKDGKLTLQQGRGASGSSWFQNISWFSFGTSMPFASASEAKKEFITIRVPESKKLSLVSLQADSGNAVCEKIQTDSLLIEADYGNVSLKEIQAGTLEADLDSGSLKIKQAAGKNCRLHNEYGDLSINGLKLTGDMQMEAESGDIQLQDVKLGGLHLASSYSSVNIRQSVFETMQMSLDSENCMLTDTLFKNCRIKSEYGDVRIELKEPVEKYDYKINTEYGEITINGNELGDSYVTMDKKQKKSIEVQCESGDIEIEEMQHGF